MIDIRCTLLEIRGSQDHSIELRDLKHSMPGRGSFSSGSDTSIISLPTRPAPEVVEAPTKSESETSMATPPKTVKVAAIQSEPVWNDLQGGVDKAIALIKEASSAGANVIGFPEVFIPGYPWYVLFWTCCECTQGSQILTMSQGNLGSVSWQLRRIHGRVFPQFSRQRITGNGSNQRCRSGSWCVCRPWIQRTL